MSEIRQRWQKFCERRDAALMRTGRTAKAVQVVAVSKLHDAASVAAHLKEIPEFPHLLGENYLQELQEKARAPELASLTIEWHFIGALQSRKIPEVCAIAQVIHSVGRVKELEALAKVRFESSDNEMPFFYVQFNISGEGSKNGFEPEESSLVTDALERLSLQDKFLGLMGSAAPLETAGEAGVRASFAQLRELRDRYFSDKELNMGMSADFELAIAEGSDLVRVGTLLFGERG
ncbi:MAG TPA: YggS family pyridoxal phosphate-dependent enzyme [Bdellovibrionota bacterium]|jgi:pyridoxal phosphate enzyme (YggS family)|nr:YggS family pyridoxal phosphate-dependent enzyme [Bdellovibrionota bacterium]